MLDSARLRAQSDFKKTSVRSVISVVNYIQIDEGEQHEQTDG
jgi:hypothetical protein